MLFRSESLRPIQERYAAIAADPGAIETVLGRGRERAEAVAGATLARLQQALGFLPRTN